VFHLHLGLALAPRPYFLKKSNIPLVCPRCGFQATKPSQIQLHHEEDTSDDESGDENLSQEDLATKKTYKGGGLKNAPGYNTSTNVEPLCANCHSLEHHPRGDIEKAQCGSWIGKKTTNRAFDNPQDMFTANCRYRYTIQKKYYIRCILKDPSEYKCKICGTSYWKNNQDPNDTSPGQQLVLQFHHKDRNRKNALLSNVELLCPNCHAAQ
jgi:5-methylcytosine-specific restriction endonuclease McrA